MFNSNNDHLHEYEQHHLPHESLPITIKTENHMHHDHGMSHEMSQHGMHGNHMSHMTTSSHMSSHTSSQSHMTMPLLRTNSFGWTSDELMGMISHTPPSFSPGSLEVPHLKKTRSGSISGRLRSASDLEERGVINRYQKGVIKVIIQ